MEDHAPGTLHQRLHQHAGNAVPMAARNPSSTASPASSCGSGRMACCGSKGPIVRACLLPDRTPPSWQRGAVIAAGERQEPRPCAHATIEPVLRSHLHGHLDGHDPLSAKTHGSNRRQQRRQALRQTLRRSCVSRRTSHAACVPIGAAPPGGYAGGCSRGTPSTSSRCRRSAHARRLKQCARRPCATRATAGPPHAIWV